MLTTYIPYLSNHVLVAVEWWGGCIDGTGLDWYNWPDVDCVNTWKLYLYNFPLCRSTNILPTTAAVVTVDAIGSFGRGHSTKKCRNSGLLFLQVGAWDEAKTVVSPEPIMLWILEESRGFHFTFAHPSVIRTNDAHISHDIQDRLTPEFVLFATGKQGGNDGC